MAKAIEIKQKSIRKLNKDINSLFDLVWFVQFISHSEIVAYKSFTTSLAK